MVEPYYAFEARMCTSERKGKKTKAICVNVARMVKGITVYSLPTLHRRVVLRTKCFLAARAKKISEGITEARITLGKKEGGLSLHIPAKKNAGERLLPNF